MQKKVYLCALFIKIMKKIVIIIALLSLVGVLGNRYYRLNYCNFTSHDGEAHSYYIYPYATVDSVIQLLSADYKVGSLYQWKRHLRKEGLTEIQEGHYQFPAKMGDKLLIRRLKLGEEKPIRLTFTHAIRTPEQLAGHLSKQLFLDSASIVNRMYDKEFMATYGLKPETAITLFLPDTYEVYWSITVDQLFARMAKEYKRFWTDERKAKANALKLTQSEVATLASIVESETNKQNEYPTIASIYLNRLRKGAPLQACPTVIFAQRDFSKRRVLKKDLTFESPYNTYKYRGLPPGPIRCTRKSTIDAVLDAPKTNYWYMCANPDFSGTHVFTTSLRDHQRVAAQYQKELNRRRVR